MKLLAPTQDRLMVRHVLPAAIRCFFHVYEEPLGNHAFGLMRHVLVAPGSPASIMKTGCERIMDPRDYVHVTNDIVVDRTWCMTCAAVVASEERRGHAPTPREVVRPLTKEVT